jgi:integrase
MSTHQLKDGRWICRHEKGKDPERPNANKKYFGRGVEAERAARDFDILLHRKPVKISSPLFLDICEAFIEAKAQVIANTTMARLLVRLNGTILPEIGQAMAAEITPAWLDSYAAGRVKDGVKRTTIHREIADIRSILRWSVKRRLIAANPMEGFEMPRRDDARISPPSEVEFKAILACAVPHLKRAMLISWYTGLRPGIEELLSLRWDAVDMPGGMLLVISAQKGGLPSRMVPLHRDLVDYLRRWYQEDEKNGLGFMVHYNGGRVDSLKTAWKNAKRRAMVTRRLRLYDIRHAFITQLLAAGANLKAVSEIAGHASPDMTMRVYQHVSDDLRRQAVDMLGAGNAPGNGQQSQQNKG